LISKLKCDLIYKHFQPKSKPISPWVTGVNGIKVISDFQVLVGIHNLSLYYIVGGAELENGINNMMIRNSVW